LSSFYKPLNDKVELCLKTISSLTQVIFGIPNVKTTSWQESIVYDDKSTKVRPFTVP